ncbi:MAG: Energy-coupling factor transporter transmembrane protein EcfT [Candidatus Bathyarchaeota archaeon B26-2]|nr:MAG: Energy-coupling factor transporter transmembrane protein EcfT [Candidatus Bathyarchaeota archaeon B26-2]
MSMFDGFKFRRVSSPIHRLDPRVKFLYVCVMFGVAVLFIQLIPLLVLFLIQLPLIIVARVQREWVRSMKGSVLFAVMIFVMNAVSLYFYGGFESIVPVIERSLAVTIRFLVLIESFSIFFLTTSPDHLGLALEQSGVPYDICFAFTTAVRFVPVLAEEAQTIIDAQRARGLELEKGNFVSRVRKYIPILIPLIVSAIRRSLELAEAMESRAWGATAKRTNLYVLKMSRGDYYLLAASVLMLAFSLYVWFYVPIPSLSDLIPS